MKEKIEKLIQSSNYLDILLGIELSYRLPIEEFFNFWNPSGKHNHYEPRVSPYKGKWIAFGRDNWEFHITDDGHIHCYVGINVQDEDTQRGFYDEKTRWFYAKYSRT